MRYDYALGLGLPLFLMGIAFFRSRILYIKKGFIATATVFKQVEHLDEEDNICYRPYFSFTTHYNKEVIYTHIRSSQWQHKWPIGKQAKVVYRTDLNEKHEILLLTFYDTFAFSTTFLTVGFFILLLAGGVYLNVADKKLAFLIPISTAAFFSALYLWALRFINSLTNERTGFL